jgi:SAM-dependent methyltransferase
MMMGMRARYSAKIAEHNLRLARGLPRRASRWLSGYRRYYADMRRYMRSMGSEGAHEKLVLFPQIRDWTATTDFDTHYVYQGTWLFEKLLQRKPPTHVDVGSYIGYMGFISALFPTTFIDIRPTGAKFEGFSERKGSVLDLPYEDGEILSLSCLHVIEHIGLGRYGDPLDLDGSAKALAELQRVLAPGGDLYLSAPSGRSATYFNAHRVFDPAVIVEALDELELVQLDAVLDGEQQVRPVTLGELRDNAYACGMYWFKRPLHRGEPS